MPSLALKVDCDTFEGTRDGIPNLLRALERAGVRASFFFTLGPDTSGRAIFRVFTQKGFLRKMLRSNAAALYGPRTMLSGTLLPARPIGRRLADTIRSVSAAGHEVGVHGWDHIRWHDRLGKMSEARIESDYGRAHAEFERIFGIRARASAAPGWHATPTSLRVQDRYHLLYASNTRNGSPCWIADGDDHFKTLEIPSTLPTWDEVLGLPEFRDTGALIAHFSAIVRGVEVHSIHTEVEGSARHDLFVRQLDRWQSDGVHFVTLEEIATDHLANAALIPVRRLVRAAIPHRGGLVSLTR